MLRPLACYNHSLTMVCRELKRWSAAGLLAIATLGGCGVGNFVLRHAANITDPPDVEVVTLPSTFNLEPATGAATAAEDWVLASTITAGLMPSDDEASRFDLSTFLARDPWVGRWSAPLPTEQRVFVKPAELRRVELEDGDWNERFVVQLAENHGPDIRRGTDENVRLTFEDIARVLCPAGVSRQLLNSNPTEAVYESSFKKCPRFGPDRVVLTREVFGNWDMMRHSQAVYSFTYEVRGTSFTPAQRAQGLKLVRAPELQMATWDGYKHPLFRDAQLRIITRE